MPPRAFVYILRCADDTLYTGYTVDLNRRLKQHQSGNGGRYTHTRTPVELVYCESHKTRREAMQREAFIKRLPRPKKQLLIRERHLRLKASHIQLSPKSNHQATKAQRSPC